MYLLVLSLSDGEEQSHVLIKEVKELLRLSRRGGVLRVRCLAIWKVMGTNKNQEPGENRARRRRWWRRWARTYATVIQGPLLSSTLFTTSTKTGVLTPLHSQVTVPETPRSLFISTEKKVNPQCKMSCCMGQELGRAWSLILDAFHPDVLRSK